MMGHRPRTPCQKVIEFAIDKPVRSAGSYRHRASPSRPAPGTEGVAAQVLMNIGLKLGDIRCHHEPPRRRRRVARRHLPKSGLGVMLSAPGVRAAKGRNRAPGKKHPRSTVSADSDGTRPPKLDPVIGREDEIERTMQILSRRTRTTLFFGKTGVKNRCRRVCAAGCQSVRNFFSASGSSFSTWR